MRTIVDKTNPALRQKTRDIPLKNIKSATVRGLIRDMKKLLAGESYGVALAAPQVGESVRLFIVAGKALAKHSEINVGDSVEMPKDQVYINPVFTKLSRGKLNMHEGCLSVRGRWGEVPRAEKATIEAYDEHGKKFSRGASGFLAHIFQHEMDHLEGVLYTDRAVKMYAEQQKSEA
ncbi:peptide deformylase [Candidatus Kaiserbacteria bacterium RIFCSPHIGHO2_01_FULL_50_13]|uniref:Peptide deformylase n=1 Tax=Candidatus Kaiserbacteria bacterium RIFCSPLOWO2_01_FULL_50_24 TaxID=1798507 RepID=A0A1F6EIJ7_9BACT|nr:MAG: peptide deformylase [Candidatus Kaiserbacteria bacterium RIFCSPHIGHO2_01_FULL_50_13]OGG73475.1 MAG: peptide deformylase [Candidatus Kaiserbacteria bacterium RIFCSPLOWO2_01_FULL_50_24]OGG80859.1 MAG: peptide deformylase [Candidatus Kaiserbacteria bacterium RIFCSPLOWO2_02_FULL_51_13]